MNAQFSAIVDDFERARSALHRLSDTTPDDLWARRSHPASWSIAECVAHLNLTSKAYIPLLRAAFDGHPPASEAPARYRRDFWGWLIGSFTGPLPQVGSYRIGRIKTRPAFVPSGPFDRDRLIPEFEALQNEQIELTRAAAGRPLEAIRIVSPFDSRVRYNAYSCLWMIPRHQHRHLGQAAEVWSGYPGV